MKRLFFIMIMINIIASCAQEKYTSYPSNIKKINIGDEIILNIPNNKDGRFLNSTDLNDLVLFVNKSSYLVSIEIHIFIGSDELSSRYSEALTKSLLAILGKECDKGRVEVYSKGAEVPIFFDKSDKEIYSNKNSRLIVRFL